MPETPLTQRVCADGYEWTRPRHPLGPTVLVQRSRNVGRQYAPMTDEPYLYRAFAKLDLTDEAVQAFANAHGLLGIGQRFLLRDGTDIVGEAQEAWHEEIRAMRRVLGQWDALRALHQPRDVGVGALELLLPHALWERVGEARTTTARRREATRLLQGQIELTMREKMRLYVQRGLSISGDGFVLDDRPTSLTGALWLQCALALTGMVDFRPCANPKCHNRIRVSKDQVGRKRDYRFCSGRCRATVHQDLRLLVRRLDREGRSIREIAKDTGMPRDTIRKWLGPRH